MERDKLRKKASNSPGKRKHFVGIFWECCRVYSRIYLNKNKTAYVGWCPRCTKRVQMNISPTGSKGRFFNVK